MSVDDIWGSRNSLETLLAPITPEVFLQEYWGQAPLYIPGVAAKFDTLFSLNRLRELLAQPQVSPSVLVRGTFDRGGSFVRVRSQEAMMLYEAGATLCIDGMSQLDKMLGTVAANIRTQLHFAGPASFRAYLSPDNSGFRMHFDARIATTLQIEGSKRWRYSVGRAIDWPHYQAISDMKGGLKTDRPVQTWEAYRPPEEFEFNEVVLKPGDILCLPAGTWHSASADGHSLALNLAFGGSGGFWATLSPVISRLLVMNPAWREPPPPCIDVDQVDHMLPGNLSTYLQERMTELIDLLGTIREDPESVFQLWLQMLRTPNQTETALPATNRESL